MANKEADQSYIHHLVWLDKNIENDINQQKLHQLREFDDKIKSFTSKTQCIDYIRKQDDRNTKSYIILIVSASFSAQVIPIIHDCICILAIFIFCTTSEQVHDLKLEKIQPICTDTDQLIDRIRNYINRDKTSIDFSLFNNQNTTDSGNFHRTISQESPLFFFHSIETTSLKGKSNKKYPIRNLKEDQARFLWFYKCHHFMMELNDDDRQAKQEMISCCRQNYKEDERALKTINKFENQSFDENATDAIYWYTQNSIIFRCINEALVSGNISTIYSYRYMIKLLCQQLKNLHEEYQRTHSKKKLRLYRGQLLKLSEILLISKHKNDLISLNGFISTSLEEDIAKKFCFGRQKEIEDYEPVLFEIEIDLTNEQSVAFADISHISQFPEEEEILISIGSIFRIESVEFDEIKQFYRIHLLLSPYEQLTVNHYIEQTFVKEVDSIDQSVLFGKLLFDMGECEFAIEYFKTRIDYLSDVDNHHRATYLNNIGVCYNEIGKKDQALKYYKTASQIYAQRDNHRGLGACYHNVNHQIRFFLYF
jgi:tetratricopeptide (TPR) repeat protein